MCEIGTLRPRPVSESCVRALSLRPRPHTPVPGDVAGESTRRIATTTIWRTVVGQPIPDEQRQRLLYIAKNCPVARLLEGGIVTDTVLDGDARRATPPRVTAIVAPVAAWLAARLAARLTAPDAVRAAAAGHTIEGQRLDETEVGEGTAVVPISDARPVERAATSNPPDCAEWLGLDADAPGMVSWDVYDTVHRRPATVRPILRDRRVRIRNAPSSRQG